MAKTKNEQMEKIRAAILAHRGGLIGATDTQILIIWTSLDRETRQKYLADLEKLQVKTRNGD